MIFPFLTPRNKFHRRENLLPHETRGKTKTREGKEDREADRVNLIWKRNASWIVSWKQTRRKKAKLSAKTQKKGRIWKIKPKYHLLSKQNHRTHVQYETTWMMSWIRTFHKTNSTGQTWSKLLSSIKSSSLALNDSTQDTYSLIQDPINIIWCLLW